MSDSTFKKKPEQLSVVLFLQSAILLIVGTIVLMYFVRENSFILGSLVLVLVFFILVFFNLVLNLLSLALRKNFTFTTKINRPLSGVLYKVSLFISRFAGLKERFERSFIFFNSSLVGIKKILLKPGEILVLLPRCIQNGDCKYNVVNNLENCISCGKCDIKVIREAVKDNGVKVAVVTGGSQARDLIKKFAPRAIIAVACERELVSGIFDVPGCEVVGLLNERPEGPCLNTRASVLELKEAIEKFLTGS